MYPLDFRIVIIKKGEIVEAMPSKIILMMPKNQESNKFQKSRIIKIKIQVKNQDSRFKNQEKTQSR